MSVNKWWWQLSGWPQTVGAHHTDWLAGVLTALLAAVVEVWIPWELPGFVDVAAIESLLTIIASSMLAVTTFSLGVMTSAYGSATSNVTPRATKLLMEDPITQTVLASFIGSFIFSVVGMIVLRFGAYGERGRVVLFIVTIAVIALIVVNLLRWIDYLTRFRRMGRRWAASKTPPAPRCSSAWRSPIWAGSAGRFRSTRRRQVLRLLQSRWAMCSTSTCPRWRRLPRRQEGRSTWEPHRAGMCLWTHRWRGWCAVHRHRPKRWKRLCPPYVPASAWAMSAILSRTRVLAWR